MQLYIHRSDDPILTVLNLNLPGKVAAILADRLAGFYVASLFFACITTRYKPIDTAKNINIAPLNQTKRDLKPSILNSVKILEMLIIDKIMGNKIVYRVEAQLRKSGYSLRYETPSRVNAFFSYSSHNRSSSVCMYLYWRSMNTTD